MWSRGVRARLHLGCLLALLGVAATASAEPFSDYEKESIRIGVTEVGGEIDPAPGRKRIESVEIVALEVFEPRDVIPRFLNWFHATSRKKVIERELLLKVGDRYDVGRVHESERNLRVPQLSAVLIVPLKGSSSDRVRLLVVTKDVWSLRLNWDLALVNDKLQSLYLQPSEENFLGLHKTVYANIFLDRPTYTLGLGFVDPRVAGSRLQAAANANVVFDCTTNAVEGSNGEFSYGKPLYSTFTEWGWAAKVGWNEGIVRPAGTVGQSICSGDRAVGIDFTSTPTPDNVPYEFHQDVIQGEFSAVRSFGDANKNDVSFGLEADRFVYRPPDLSREPAIVQEDFQRLLPVSDTRLSPFVQLHAYRKRFLRVLDLETLGLQEDYQLGHEVYLRAYPAMRALGSTRNLLGLAAEASYTVGFSDGLARVYGLSSIQLSAPEESDGSAEAGVRIVTPRLPFGRIVYDGSVLDRYDNYLNPLQTLGGTTRLRGYRSQAFVGPELLVSNVEVRSRPIEIFSVQAGLVAFYDVGDAFQNFSTMKLRQGVGGGLRLAFPFFEREVFRVDVGVPLDRHDPAAETSVIVKFQQAFGMPEVGTPGFVDYGPASLQ